MWVLKSHLKCPPGSFPYEQTEGINRKFESTPLIEEQANRVVAFRKGNGLSRASFPEALQDIDAYTCYRLGNNPRFCYNTEKSFSEVAPMAHRGKTGGCGGCGASV